MYSSDLPLNPTTEFFREPNQAHYVNQVSAMQQILLKDRELRIGEVGCSTGEETWSLASALETRNVSYSIDAYDVNPDALKHARRGRYQARMGHLAMLHEVCDFDRYCLEQFDYRGNGKEVDMRVPREMRKKAAFATHNILNDPLPADRYDTIVIANVLYHYTENADRDRIMTNVLTGLRAGGVLILETSIRETENKYEYWVEALPEKFALQSLRGAMRHHPTIWRTTPNANDHIQHL